MTIAERYDETIDVPRAVRFPVELIPPEGFDSERLETWPKVDGRLEYVNGRLLYMPPCGALQQDTVTDVVALLAVWRSTHPAFAVGSNEAGMVLRGDTRGADAAVWRRSDLGPYSHQFRHVPPILAVEVAGEDDDEHVLRAKAQWYLSTGVQLVWIVLPEHREVVVITGAGEHRCRAGDTLPLHPALPDLAPQVAEFFVQISTK